MKWVSVVIVGVVMAVCVSTTVGQDRVARTSTGASQAAVNNPSQAQAAIAQAAAANKFMFIFFWKDQNQQTDKVWNILQPTVAKMADQADTVSIQTTNPAEKAIVDRFGASRAPMPLVLAIAPCGAITKAFTGAFDENQLRTAFVSPCTQQSMKALQDSKLVMICILDQAGQPDSVVLPKGVQDFKADEKYGRATEIVVLNARDQAEESFLKDLQVDVNASKPVIVLFAPPASMISKFDATATKQQIIAKLTSAQSGCCPGGKCGPNGCCPKK
jgi:hypothetical protein